MSVATVRSSQQILDSAPCTNQVLVQVGDPIFFFARLVLLVHFALTIYIFDVVCVLMYLVL